MQIRAALRKRFGVKIAFASWPVWRCLERVDGDLSWWRLVKDKQYAR